MLSYKVLSTQAPSSGLCTKSSVRFPERSKTTIKSQIHEYSRQHHIDSIKSHTSILQLYWNLLPHFDDLDPGKEETSLDSDVSGRMLDVSIFGNI